jgi:hypothetical protein
VGDRGHNSIDLLWRQRLLIAAMACAIAPMR